MPPPRTVSFAPSPPASPTPQHWQGIRAFDDNQTRAWPGRIDPCNMAQKVQPLLQVLVDQLANGNLTPAQQALAKQDLAMIATRCLCQGHVGADQALTIHVNGQPLRLDAIDLTLLLNKLPQQQDLHVNAFVQAAQNSTRSAQAPRKINLKNPERQVSANVTGDDVASLQRLFAQPNLASPMYGEMNELIRQAPLKALNSQQQLVAKQVIDLLPTAAQGKLRNVPARLIGVHDFVEVMRAAANQKQLPPELQQFRDSCARNDGLKKAIYCNPDIAARILGLPAPSPGNQPSNKRLAHDIAAQIVEPTAQANTPRTQVSKVVKRFTSASSQAMISIKQVFRALGEYAGFASQEMANVPSCFAEIECPAASKVPINASIHANVVSLGHGRQAVAAMQPVITPGSSSSNLPAFYQLLASEPNTTVFDLRSNRDFEQGSFDYCPAVNTTRLIHNAVTGEQTQITTVNKTPLPHAQSDELTVRIQIGDQAPKTIKVIQFKNWPDHGVITADQLRSLRSLMGRELSGNQHVITHCRAGVGRTGTLLAYEHLHHDLIDQNNGRAMVNAKGKVDSQKLLQAITEVVVQGRIERGPYFVQSEDQFVLLYETLKADLLANAAANPKVAAPPSPQPGPVKLPNKQMGLGGHPASVFSPEPASKNHGLQQWQSILDAGDDVVEIVSSANRLLGSTSPSNSGLGVFLNQLSQVGNNRVLEIRPMDHTQTQANGDLVHKQQFEIQYQTLGDDQIKTLRFTQFLTPFDGKKLTASQLNTITEQLGEAGHIKPKWLTSVRGVGRPSALLVAQAMREEIGKGTINNEQNLIKVLDGWIEKGREKIGPLFINSREQREQLIELGKAWLSNNGSGRPRIKA